MSSCGSQTYGIIACSDHLIAKEVDGTTKYYLSQADARANAPTGVDENTLVGDQEVPNNTKGVNTFIDVGSTAVGGTQWWAYPGDDFAGAATGKQSLTNADMTKSITARNTYILFLPY